MLQKERHYGTISRRQDQRGHLPLSWSHGRVDVDVLSHALAGDVWSDSCLAEMVVLKLVEKVATIPTTTCLERSVSEDRVHQKKENCNKGAVWFSIL
jgi:hypothetical protein